MSQETEIIKERVDLAELIGEYVPLKRAGASYKGVCPFHNEKTPSFVVTPEKNIWHCFGCSEGGDHFSFIEKIEGIDFREALTMLAQRAGVELSQYNAKASSENQSRKTRLFDLLDLTAKFYHEVLVNQKAGVKAKEYMKKRGVKEKSIEEFQVGYAPNQWDTLQQFLQKQGYNRDEMEAAGLIGKSDRGSFYDRFRGRIMFPIQDSQGRVVAFGGRILPEHETGNEGKYVNSPETELYVKRKIIYNLNRAKQDIRKSEAAIVVEGYMDVVMLHQAGIANVVASSGTAFTPEQIKLLERYTVNLKFAFDSDAAGIKAALAATQSALNHGLRVAVIAMPEGQDPADIALAGAASAKKTFSNTISLVQLMLQRLQTNAASDKDIAFEQLLPVLQQVKHPVQQGELVQEVATTLSVPESVIIDKLAALPKSPDDIAPSPENTEPAENSSINLSAQKLLIGLFLLEPEVLQNISVDFSPQYWGDSEAQDVFEKLNNGEDLSQNPAALSLVALAQSHLEHSKEPVSELAAKLATNIKRQSLQDHLKRLHLELGSNSQKEKDRILAEVNETAKALASLT